MGQVPETGAWLLSGAGGYYPLAVGGGRGVCVCEPLLKLALGRKADWSMLATGKRSLETELSEELGCESAM